MGPAEDPREAASRPLGVPGPRDDWRRLDEVAGMARWCGFIRRRFEGSVDGERFPARAGFKWGEAAAFVVEGTAVVSGEGCRAEGCTRRVMGLLAMVVEGPALPERGCRGVEAPVVEAERGGSRVERDVLFNKEGSWGSGWIAPSFWRSRILKSRRLIWRSSWSLCKERESEGILSDSELTRTAAFSLRLTFSS